MQLLADTNSLILLITFAINFGLGLSMLFREKRSAALRAFGALLLCLGFWAFTLVLFFLTPDRQWVLFWHRLTLPAVAWAAACFLCLSLVFPDRDDTLPTTFKLGIFGPAVIFSLLAVFTDWLIGGMISGRPLFGPAYYLCALYCGGLFIAGQINLLSKYLSSAGWQKLAVFGVGLTGLVGIMTSLVLPILGVYSYSALGPACSLIMIALIIHVLIRAKLLEADNFLSRVVPLLSFMVFLAGTAFFVAGGQINYLLAFYVVLANSFAGLFVISRNWRSRQNQVFCLLTLCLTCWTLGLSIFQITGVLFWGKITYTFAPLIPPIFLSFVRLFPRVVERPRPSEFLLYLAGLSLAFLTWTDLIIKEVGLVPWGYTLVLGPWYPVFTIFFVGATFWAFGRLFVKYHHSSGINRIQIMYVFMGMFLAALIGISVAIVLPFLGFSRLYYLAPPATLIMIASIAYAIVKHRLMSIEVVIQRSAVYATVTLLIMSVYALAVMVSEIYLRRILGYSSLLVTALAALIIAMLYQPLVRLIQNFTDRVFFRWRYDYQKTLSRISQQIAAVIRLDELVNLIVASLSETMKIAEISFLLPQREHFRSLPLNLPGYKRIEIDTQNPIIVRLVATREVLVREEIEGQLGDAMERLGILVWQPIVSQDKLIGIIALGNKLSGDSYTAEDLALLATLANQTAVALENARLYDEVLAMKNYNEEILQNMTSGVLTTDPRGKLITYNSMADKITGRRTADVIGRSCEEVWGKRGAVTQAVEATLRGHACLNFEAGINSPERGLVPVAFSSTLLRDSQGKKSGALLLIQDLTEMKELEGKIRRADKLTALATMAAGMAHEIKNPLSSMKVFAQLLPLKINDPEYRQKLGEILPREIDRIDRIVESLLGFARSTALTFEKIKIEEVLEADLKYFASKAEDAGVKITRHYTELPPVEIDKDQLGQVFSNLILNAIQAMPEGGELTVTTAPGKKVEELLQTIKVSVADTGHGITDEMLKKLFDPFFTTKYGGTGLGLTVSHSIVDGHKGFIDVESKLGKGTTFTVTLPLSQGLL